MAAKFGSDVLAK